VRDILEAIERIQRYTAAGRQSFEVSELVQAWVVHHLEIVGEAACRLSDEWRRGHPDVPVRGIVGMRNALAHGYFEIDAVAVWNVVERDLPVLAGRLSSVKEPARHDTGQDDRAARGVRRRYAPGAADTEAGAELQRVAVRADARVTRRRGHRETPSAGGPVHGGVHDLVGEGPARDERRVLRSAALVRTAVQ